MSSSQCQGSKRTLAIDPSHREPPAITDHLNSHSEPPSDDDPPDQAVDDQGHLSDYDPPDQAVDDQDPPVDRDPPDQQADRPLDVATVPPLRVQQAHRRPVMRVPRSRAALIPHMTQNDALYDLAISQCHPEIGKKLHAFMTDHMARHGHLNMIFAYGPLSSFVLPELSRCMDQDGCYEWRWAKDSSGIITICSYTIAAVAHATQERANAHIVTLVSPATPVLVYMPIGSNFIKPGAPLFAISRVNIYNHLLRMANGIPGVYNVYKMHVVAWWLGGSRGLYPDESELTSFDLQVLSPPSTTKC